MGMKCYYEILNVSQDATEEDLKRSYRKLALQWHPDKNLDNVEEAKEQFQTVQQAYEVLNDPQERAWYDKHRDSILKGGLGKDYNDDSLNLYPYFSTSCFKGYGDDDKGFYTVFREVFNKISAEDSQFDSDLDSEDEIPDFGDSRSSYESKVHAFYGYWQSYSTKRSYSWLDEFDTRTAPNRRVARLMEKENKKLRDAARRERNEQVRTLVAFVRKRDKRVQEYAKILEERAAQNADKVKQIKLEQHRERQEEIERQIRSQSEWSKFSNFEDELKLIEENLAAEFNDELSDGEYNSDEEEEELFTGNLYCSACNKLFKTEKAFVNHEKSKKHKEKVEEMEFDDAALEALGADFDEGSVPEASLEKLDMDEPQDDISLSDHIGSLSDELTVDEPKKSKKKKKNKIQVLHSYSTDSELEETLPVLNTDSDSDIKTKKTKNKQSKKKIINKIEVKTKISETLLEENIVVDKTETNNPSKNKRKKNKTKNSDVQRTSQTQEPKPAEPCDKVDHVCKACTSTFVSNNDLYKHLRKTGHAVPISTKDKIDPAQMSSKSKKKTKN